MNETQWQKTVLDYAETQHWHRAHFRTAMTRRTRDGKPVYMTPVSADAKGWPDLVLVRERVVWVELKSEKGRLSPEQENWRDWLREAGQEWYCWKPSDWDSVQETLKELRNDRTL